MLAAAREMIEWELPDSGYLLSSGLGEDTLAAVYRAMFLARPRDRHRGPSNAAKGRGRSPAARIRSGSKSRPVAGAEI